MSIDTERDEAERLAGYTLEERLAMRRAEKAAVPTAQQRLALAPLATALRRYYMNRLLNPEESNAT
jgi:hypothetical protein